MSSTAKSCSSIRRRFHAEHSRQVGGVAVQVGVVGGEGTREGETAQITRGREAEGAVGAAGSRDSLEPRHRPSRISMWRRKRG